MASVSRRTVTWTSSAGKARTATKYQADYYDRTGRRHRRMFDLKKDALRWLDEQTASLLTGQWASPQAGKEAVRAYGERWLARQVLADSTLATYATVLGNHILPMLGPMRMDLVSRDDVQLLVKEWLLSAAPTTVHARYLILAIMFRAAVKDRVLPATPCVDIKLPRLPAKSSLVPISTDMVQAMREAMMPRYRLFVTLGAGTGMRRGEILGLTLDRISFDFRTIRVDRQLARTSSHGMPVFGLPKTPSSTRTIPVGDVVMAALREHLAEFGRHESGCCSPPRAATFQGRAPCRAPGSEPHDASEPLPRRTTCGTTSPRTDPGRAVHQGAAGPARPQVGRRDLGHLRPPDGGRGRTQPSDHGLAAR